MIIILFVYRKLVILEPSQIKLSSSALRTTADAFNTAKKGSNCDEKRARLLEYYSESAKVKLPAVRYLLQTKVFLSLKIV